MNITGQDRYRIESSVGKGPSGIVYRAWDSELKRHVAIKLAHKGKGHFIAGERLLGNLVHPNIVTVYNVETIVDVSYVAMEYVNGPDLGTFCEKELLLKPLKVVEIMIDVLKGLFHGHSRGFIHRNIKPSNIILNENGVPKLSDFGIDQASGRTHQMGFWGAPDYMSPEQLIGKSVIVQSDIFSLGCVLYEMLNGKKPFHAESQYSVINKIINEDPEPLGEALPCSKILEAVVFKAISKDPDARYQGCSDFAVDLSKTLGHLNKLEKDKKSSVLRSISGRVNMFKSSAAQSLDS